MRKINMRSIPIESNYEGNIMHRLNHHLNQAIDSAKSDDATINAFISDLVYKIGHITDSSGCIYDLLDFLPDQHEFSEMSMESWLHPLKDLGYQVIALRVIQRYGYTSFIQDQWNEQCDEYLNRLMNHPYTLMAHHAYIAHTALLAGRPINLEGETGHPFKTSPLPI